MSAFFSSGGFWSSSIFFFSWAGEACLLEGSFARSFLFLSFHFPEEHVLLIVHTLPSSPPLDEEAFNFERLVDNHDTVFMSSSRLSPPTMNLSTKFKPPSRNHTPCLSIPPYTTEHL